MKPIAHLHRPPAKVCSATDALARSGLPTPNMPMPADATLQAAAAYFLSSSSSDEGEDATGAQANPRKAVRETAAGSVSSDTSKQHRRRRDRKRGRDDAGDGHKQACIPEDALHVVLPLTCHTGWYAPPASSRAHSLQGMPRHCKLQCWSEVEAKVMFCRGKQQKQKRQKSKDKPTSRRTDAEKASTMLVAATLLLRHHRLHGKACTYS